ncbi:MAG: hypothetical protein ACTSQW_06930, partial [Promethearchaeota archaeon]
MPLTSVPIQTIPIIVFFVLFLSTSPNILSVIFIIIGFTLVIISSFLLTKRQANIPEKLRVIVEKELLKMLDEAFERIITVSDISNEIRKKLVDVASDIYIDFYRRSV